MQNYTITTDTTADLPEEYIEKHNLGILSLTCTLEGVTYSKENPLDVNVFYEKMRNGSMPTTSQVNPEGVKKIFLPYLMDGQDILHISFSSGLSGSYNSVRIAVEELLEEFPERKITVIDSLAASLGEGLLVHKAVTLKEQGADMDTVTKWVEDNKLHMVHNFTVDDLFHLHRGGRVSKATAILGTMINVKPILHVDDEGHLIALSKVRGRKKSLQALVDSMEKQMGAYREQNDMVFISHGDCISDAEYVANLVKQKFGIENFLINHIGPTIGAHSGPGTVALFYLGEYR